MQNRISIFDSWITSGPGLYSFNPSECALLVIDMVYICAHPDYGVGRRLKAKGSDFGSYHYGRLQNTVIPNIQRLLEFSRKNGVEVIYLTFGPQKANSADLYPLGRLEEIRSRNDGASFDASNLKSMSILDEIAPQKDELVINKLSSGAFASSNIDAVLRNMRLSTLFFTGVCTNMCVESTAREATDRGYNGIIIDDACSTYTQRGHDATLEIFELIYGKVARTEDVISEYPWDGWSMEL